MEGAWLWTRLSDSTILGTSAIFTAGFSLQYAYNEQIFANFSGILSGSSRHLIFILANIQQLLGGKFNKRKKTDFLFCCLHPGAID
jgi:hypothetical protein